MNPMMYAGLSWSVKTVMSLCQNAFGLEYSYRRSESVCTRRLFFGGVRSPCAFVCFPTALGLAFMKNSRRNMSDIFRAPRDGSAVFSSTIFSTTAFGSPAFFHPRGLSRSPASPSVL